MIVDTSALIAILRQEKDFLRLVECITDTPGVHRISSATHLEAGIVSARGARGSLFNKLSDLILNFSLQISPFTADQSLIAINAYQVFGKGSGHPAQLNFGDCFAYALAKDLGQPLLFKGDDFSKTDIALAL